ncbi:hypothetical protein [Actinacidiphila glaucinigra]|uniref:hypothetical protein n=1 Tax=Actinacidiphila glaucinigra TaxID=235986 RepID=UPI003805279F
MGLGHARGEHAPVHQGHELREALPVRVDLDSGDADAAPGGGHGLVGARFPQSSGASAGRARATTRSPAWRASWTA